jgi:zinc/manganese transport system substrate-binding protein
MGDVRKVVVPAVLLAIVAGLAGCGSSGTAAAGGRLKVVAGENFWGNLAEQIGGSHVAVTSLISNPNADPHLFEPGTSNGLQVATAGVVIVNGANYDPFMQKLLDAAPSSKRKVVTVADVLHITGSDPNPHLWYDAPRIPTVVEAIANSFVAADPAHKSAYLAGAKHTIASLQPLEQAVAALKADDAGDPVAYTERVPGYLLADAGLRVLTPPSFAKTIEDGTDPSFSDIFAMDQLITTHRIKALLYNEQAVTAVTQHLRTLAQNSGVPVVPVTETMPVGDTFESWQLGQVVALTQALRLIKAQS